jgi:hypothetical protein
MNGLVYAVGAAVCAFGCLAHAIVGTVALLVNWRSGLALLGTAVLLGAAAKALDRQKMRAIHGRAEGERLHAANPDVPAMELAERDWAAYRSGALACPEKGLEPVAGR